MKSSMYLIKEKFPHYSRSEKDFPVRNYYALENKPSEEIYHKMVHDLFTALSEKKWFPLARMSHGEFTLCVGRPAPRGLLKRCKYWLKKMARSLNLMPMVDYRANSKSELNDGKSREKLTIKEFRQIKSRWTEAMQAISEAGIIAPAFNERVSYAECVDGMIEYFRKNQISFDKDNFAPMFGVYAFICGPDFEQLVKDRHVAVVTWIDADRERGLRSTFATMGVVSLSCVPVSPHAAALESVDPGKLEHRPDVVLFACGLGSVTLMHQFRQTNAICIDAGFALDVLANPELRGKRAWTLPDHLYDEFKRSDG